jgi:hypothetical protein
VIATRTIVASIPWRPESDPTCADPVRWRASDGNCYTGLFFPVVFDFTGVTVPNQIIYGLAYNTTNWGYHPIGVSGPYEELNFGLAKVPPTVGTNPFPDTAYWNTHTATNYTDLGAGGIDTFRRDTAWLPFSGAISIVAVTPLESYQVAYASNLTNGDSYVNLTNTGVVNGFDPAGRICANVYTFDPSEELISCCSCLVTPDGLKSLSAKQDLASNTLTPGVPGSLVVKLLTSTPVGGACNPSSPTIGTLATGLRAWGTSLHQNTASGKFEVTENVFQSSVLSDSELAKLTTYCGFIQANGSGFGICRSCRLGGLGGDRQ